MRVLDAILRYTDLRTEEPILEGSGGKRGKTQVIGRRKRGAWWWNLFTYLFVVIGVASKFIFDYWQQTRPITWMDFGISFIIGGLSFPAVYKTTTLSPDKPDKVLQYFLAFQNGFFWQTLIGGLLR